MKDTVYPVSRALMSGGGTAATAARQEEINLAGLASTLYRGKWWIALATALALLVAVVYLAALAQPLYRATAVVILDPDPHQIIDLQGIGTGFSGDTAEINSELEVFRARGLMGQVVDRLELTTDPDFNRSLRPPGLLSRLRPATDRPALSAEDLAKRERDGVISALLGRVRITNLRNSLVFNITATAQHPVTSARIADTIAEVYILDQVNAKFTAMEQAHQWLASRVSQLQASLEDAEAEVARFGATTDLVSIDALRGMERQIKDLRDRIDSAESEVAIRRARIDGIGAAHSRSDQALLAQDPALATLLSRLADDPTLSVAFDARLSTILAGEADSLLRADQQLKTLRSSETALADQIARQSDDLITLQQLTREADAIRVLYEHFLTRMKETSAQQGYQRPDSRILSNAVIPVTPAEPNALRLLTLAALFGALIGAALVLFKEIRRASFRTAHELEQATGQAVLGQMPRAPVQPYRDLLSYLSQHPASPSAEAARGLRTSLMLLDADVSPQVILSTSAMPGDGKTSTALALAQSFVGLGKRVLLIDGDIRRDTLHRFFDYMPGAGLIHVLSGDRHLTMAIHHSAIFGFDVLGGGGVNLNAADLFASTEFRAMIDETRELYDIVIVDTPPVLSVPDARIIAPMADAILLNVRWQATTDAQVLDALRQLGATGQRVSGLVLTQMGSDPGGGRTAR